jgi:HSP20 family protein
MATETKETLKPKETVAEAQKEVSKPETALVEAEKGGMPKWPVQALGDVSRFFENFFVREFPAVDVIDCDNELIVRAELPWVNKEDLSVTVGDATLTIKGNTRPEEKLEKGEYIRREISRRGSFSRTISLPIEVDPTRGKAKFRDYVLELNLPKSEKRHTLKIE